MAGRYCEHRKASDFYRLPEAAQSAFQQAVRDVRCGDRQAMEAFWEACVTDLIRPVVTLNDLVFDGLAELPVEDRPAVEKVLYGQPPGETQRNRIVHPVLAQASLGVLADR